jgi:hypothetical protein
MLKRRFTFIRMIDRQLVARAADNAARPNKVLASATPWSEIAGRLGCWPAAQSSLRSRVG